jgi:hypothetical protein
VHGQLGFPLAAPDGHMAAAARPFLIRAASPKPTSKHVRTQPGGAWKTDFSNAKVLVAALQAGNAFRIRFGGGG